MGYCQSYSGKTWSLRMILTHGIFNVCGAVDINYDKGFFDFTRWVIWLVLHDSIILEMYTASLWIKTIKTLIFLWLICKIDFSLDDAYTLRKVKVWYESIFIYKIVDWKQLFKGEFHSKIDINEEAFKGRCKYFDSIALHNFLRSEPLLNIL